MEIETLVDSVVSINQSQGQFNESNASFIQPLPWLAYEKLLASAGHKLSETEDAINDRVFQLFGVKECDRVAIEEELAALTSSEFDDGEIAEDDAVESLPMDEDATVESLSRKDIATTSGFATPSVPSLDAFNLESKTLSDVAIFPPKSPNNCVLLPTRTE